MAVDTEMKDKIDRLTHVQMCEIWRFSESGEPMLQGEAGDYFQDRLFNRLGGFTPAISKSIGWER